MEFAVKESIKFERLLKQRLGAQGKGLGEQVKSVQHRLPTCLVENLLEVSKIRNRVVHSERPMRSRESFEARCREIDQLLDAIGGSPTYFYIINKQSGKALDVTDWAVNDGSRIQQWSYAGTENQAWSLRRVEGDYFTFISKHSGKCLEIAGGDLDDGAQLQQWTYFGLEHQQWRIIELEDGTFQIMARHNSKCLDASCDHIHEDGAAIVQWTWWGGDHQRWSLKPALGYL